jgi:hypothetical protein
MSKFRKWPPSRWLDPDFRKLDRDGRLFVVYLWTSPHCTPWGCYILPDAYVMGDLDLTPEEVRCSWQAARTGRLVLRCERTQLVALPGWFEVNRPENLKSAAACIAGLQALPPSPILQPYFAGSPWIREQLDSGSLTIPEKLGDEPEPEPEPEPDN